MISSVRKYKKWNKNDKLLQSNYNKNTNKEYYNSMKEFMNIKALWYTIYYIQHQKDLELTKYF